jgi:hypothetical protein
MKSPFGWNLPPGVTNRMIEDAFGGGDPSELQESVLGLLEDAEIDTETCDKIMALIEAAELKRGWTDGASI